ncbi:PAAR domain-containing protein [Ochrobactrum sp. SFR4]|uniref:PAAR domain-containing protein n=1 Tax=Ochrobactrum sp. SFR4 TaxID=2717368 RepID=UPI00336ADD6A
MEGSTNVWINGLEALRVDDHFESHGCTSCPKLAHARALANGSPNVYINGKRAGRLNDPIDCGGAVVTGSANVYINGE